MWKTITSQRVQLANLAFHPLGSCRFKQAGSHTRVDETGTDGVDTDVCFLQLVNRRLSNTVHTAKLRSKFSAQGVHKVTHAALLALSLEA